MIFFMPTVQLEREEIRKVVILDSYVSEVLNQRFSVRLVINSAHSFSGKATLEVVEKLRDCEFYTQEQYDAVVEHLTELLQQEALVYGEQDD